MAEAIEHHGHKLADAEESTILTEAQTSFVAPETWHAIRGEDKINRVLSAYKRTFTDPFGADIMWMKARDLWKCAKAFQATGDESQEAEAQENFEEASQIHWDIPRTRMDASVAKDSTWDSRIDSIVNPPPPPASKSTLSSLQPTVSTAPPQW